jgi:hypothetical protein
MISKVRFFLDLLEDLKKFEYVDLSLRFRLSDMSTYRLIVLLAFGFMPITIDPLSILLFYEA